MLITAENSLLLVVDIQTRLTTAMEDRDGVIANASKLIEGAGVLSIPVLVSEQYPKGIGPTEPDILAKAEAASAEVIEKIHFSCAAADSVMSKVRSSGRRQVVVAGIEAHVCVLQTALGLKAQGFEVFVAQDACSSRKSIDKQTASRRLIQNGVDLVTTEMVLFEWMEKAGTPEFKQISALIK